MIYREPILDEDDKAVLQLITKLRERLAFQTQSNPRRWTGSIRRRTFAKAIQGSNSIEGYNASVDEAIGIIEDEQMDERTETWNALSGYRNALTYIMQAARDPDFEFNKQFLKSLHFMMISYNMSKNPGQWRPGAIWVTSVKTNEKVYDAPDRELVEPLIKELCEYIKKNETQDLLVKAAMAHLNLTLIHPFSDGNGRMARALQTLVLALDGIMHPVFSSIEEWLGTYTDDYYVILAEVAKGHWSPENSTQGWVRFCLKAHYQQATTLLRRMDEYAALYSEIEKIVAKYRLNDRTALPLFDSALGMTMTNARYQEDTDVTGYIAARDLRTLADKGLLDAKGETRARKYIPGKELLEARRRVRITRPVRDPYDVVREKRTSAEQPTFSFL
jgi:Fic family protein